ncbi:MAG: D-alanyl-D-alanine carboxypeptidase [Phenylobacterium sp.]|uniref:D-alanyl-D-alanine carboxypeptidase n=1 Tax=Phenylobacterium sp. TaxID=1871053 RepID=UPI003918D9CD
MALAPLVQPIQAQAASFIPSSQPKYAAIVVDASSGEVLYAKRADSPRYPASITKVMTLYLTFEALESGKLKLTDRVPISPRAAAQPPTKLGLRAGDSISVEDAMYALALKSANDIAVAMAEKLGGTESRFAALMTLRAQELGMTNTRFVNASGLPDSRQITTARDLAILSRAVMRDYPQHYKLFNTQVHVVRGQTLRNHNRLLGRMDGVDGIKTGFTNASGFNLAASAVRDGRRLIAVVLGGPSTAIRDENAQDLLLTGFDVVARRARGENITIAQNLFEPEPSGGVVRPSVEQGDGEQDELKIVLASADPPKHTSSVKPVQPAKGKWVVQVGAFRSKSDAREQLSFVKQRFGKQFAGMEGFVAEPVGGAWRSRFKGFDERSAKAACSAMKAKRLACMVVAPG